MPPTRNRTFRLALFAGLTLVLVGVAAVIVSDSGNGDVVPPVPPVPPSTPRESRLTADDLLAKLKPGMLRVDVEGILGPPSAVDSIAAGNGKLSYRATFNRDRLRPPMPPIVLEFDATQPGHPLLVIRPM